MNMVTRDSVKDGQFETPSRKTSVRVRSEKSEVAHSELTSAFSWNNVNGLMGQKQTVPFSAIQPTIYA